MFCFCYSKKYFTYYEKYFFPYLYILEKNFFVNKCKEKTCYKENKSLFFDIMENDQIFPSKVCHFQHDPRFTH